MCGEKRYVKATRASRRGITPACAGKSRAVFIIMPRFWDHPRMCGEKSFYCVARMQLQGSPPHVRGKESNARRKGQKDGITPACAGKSCADYRSNIKVQDHPRMCGEKALILHFWGPPSGSPPHVRGKANSRFFFSLILWITPACAGKRHIAAKWPDRCGDHPRMCGEKTAAFHRLHLVKGSPPHVRGKEASGIIKDDPSRITPACAGKSS